MLELDDETLKEVGRLVIEFNDLDERITALAWISTDKNSPKI